jgi:hypothetical protein
MAIWQTARFDPEEHAVPGWIGRGLDEDRQQPAAGSSLFVGTEAVPAALRGRRSIAGALAGLEDFDLSADAAAARAMASEVPASGLSSFMHRSMLDAYTMADRSQGHCAGEVELRLSRYRAGQPVTIHIRTSQGRFCR